MGKIVVLAGSLKKNGNTDRLVEAFAKGAEKNNKVDVIPVSDHNVKPCTGCNSCFEREGNKCFQHGDMTEMRDNGYSMNGAMFYIYHVSPAQTSDPDELMTEICFPVE